MIKFENVSKSYRDGTKAVDNLNLEIQKGEFFVMIGPSGCGKTTILKMINRLIPLTEGTIYINDKKISDYEINKLRWNIGYVLQQIALFPHMTIEENISIVPELKHWTKEKTNIRTKELLSMVSLEPDLFLKKKPRELSGGQQQRVGVIRALAADPDILLMDEPFSALDPISREKLQDDLINIQRSLKKSIVFVTHDMQEALKLADRICVMKKGRIEQLGTPDEILRNPKNNFVKGFIGNQSSSLKQILKIDEIVQPVMSNTPTNSISITSSLEHVLDRLSNEEELAVVEDGQIIGIINRQAVIKQLASNLNEGG
ncbi:ABC transporter ATP-binding protein [Rummeliibacillus pycnus]|uniref:ABC transporter ATP-binding protein n=1 Tax=Rummeliibacillus pycnus TaxID=101070 RepID=UPI003D2E4561